MRMITVQPTFAMPVRWDFPCRTNSDYTEELSFQVGGAYLDLTGYSFEVQIRTAPTAPTALKTLSTVASATAEGIYPVEPENGFIQLRLLRASTLALFNAVYPSLLVGDQVQLYYDLLVTLPSGDKEAWLMGYFTISKGVTNG